MVAEDCTGCKAFQLRNDLWTGMEENYFLCATKFQGND